MDEKLIKRVIGLPGEKIEFKLTNEKKTKIKLDLNKEKNVIQIKSALLNTFTFGSNQAKNTINEKKMYYFKNFLQTIAQSSLSGINYEIKDSDYYEYITDSENKKSMTIFNNERAALKKCEMIYNSLKGYFQMNKLFILPY